MKLYTINGQSLREPRSWAGTQDEAKKGAKAIGGFWEPVEVPTDKPGLIAFLNGMEEPRYPQGNQEVDELHLAEQRAIAAARPRSDIVDQPSAGACSTCGRHYGYDHYESAMTARTSLAQIDAGMIARAIGQFHGSELSKVVSAAIERMRELALQVGGDVQEGV